MAGETGVSALVLTLFGLLEVFLGLLETVLEAILVGVLSFLGITSSS
jgi:hypothetical protein